MLKCDAEIDGLKADATRRAAAYLAGDMTCSEAAMRAVAETLGLPLDEQLYSAAAIYHHGAGTGDRCGVFEAGILLIGYLYGRLEPDLTHQGDRFLGEKLYDRYLAAYGSYFCRDIRAGPVGCTIHQAVPWLVELVCKGDEIIKEAPTGPKS